MIQMAEGYWLALSIGVSVLILIVISVVVLLCASKKRTKENSLSIDFTENKVNTSQLHIDIETEEAKDQMGEPSNGLKACARSEPTRSPVNKKWYDSTALEFMDASRDSIDQI